jgi:hypothetical protein
MSDTVRIAKEWMLPKEIDSSELVMVKYTNSYDIKYKRKKGRTFAVRGRTLEGFVITKKSTWEAAVLRFLDKTYPVTHWLNFQHTESVEFEDLSAWTYFKVSSLTQEEFTVIDNLFGRQYGVFPNELFMKDTE